MKMPRDTKDANAMTPVETTPQRLIGSHLVPANLLTGGELVLLAIKPSGWFVLITSLPILISAGVVSIVAYIVGIYRSDSPTETVLCLCAAAGFIRIVIACWQWIGRTYVLTNRRVITVRGVIRVRVSAVRLIDVERAILTEQLAERMVGTGSIYCLTVSKNTPALVWNTISRPGEVHEIVISTIEHAKRVEPPSNRSVQSS